MRRLLVLWAAGSAFATGALAAGMSLAGEWRFSLDAEKEGVRKEFFARDLPLRISLPGSTDQARYGTPNPNRPSLDGLYRLYLYEGPAWYQRDVEIPQSWRGKRVSLVLERAHWETQVWLDGQPLGKQDSLIAPHIYDLGAAATPGKHRLTICVDNTKKIDLGRFVSINYEGTQTNWNGLIGKLELRADDPVSIADVQVYPDVARKLARVRITVANHTGRPAEGKLTLATALRAGGARVPPVETRFTAPEPGATVTAELPMGNNVRLWDEFSPALYDLTVSLASGTFADSKSVAFGMREFATKGTQFTVNGRPIFLRGTLECAIFPLTGYPPTDVESWVRIYRIIKSYGLNHMRFHSWTPPEAAFAAADLEGIYLQTEGPQANVQAGRDAPRDAFLEAELLRIVRTYGNHPSFVMLTPGNEFGGPMELMTRWVDMLIKEDPRHLYSSASNNNLITPNRQFTVSSRPRGVQGTSTAFDFREAVSKQDRPLVGHEIGQWTFYPNFDEIKKYTGVLAAKNFELIRDDLATKHMLDLAPRIVQATGRQATLLYKEEMELMLRTPGHAGFQLLDLHDYPGQGTALIGILDPFWDTKGFVTPEQHRRYAGPTVPLLRIPKRTYTAAEPFTAEVDVAHFGPADLPKTEVEWALREERGGVVASGTLPAIALPTGKLSPVGKFEASLARSHAPAKLTLSVSLKGTQFANDWDIWVYPADEPLAPAGVLVARNWPDAARALAEGRKVLLFPASVNAAKSRPGKFLPVFWSSVWFPNRQPSTMGVLCDPKHPALAQFPTAFYSDWQWYDLIQNSRSVILDDTPAAYRPIVQVMDTFERNGKIGNVFEARVGSGSLLVSTIDLPAIESRQPAARQLLRSLYAYLASPAFKPTGELPEAWLADLFR